MSEQQGLHDKYIVTKVDGSPIDPDAQYFVLRLDTDIAARVALRAYAGQCKYYNSQLAFDLQQWLRDIQSKREQREQKK